MVEEKEEKPVDRGAESFVIAEEYKTKPDSDGNKFTENTA